MSEAENIHGRITIFGCDGGRIELETDDARRLGYWINAIAGNREVSCVQLTRAKLEALCAAARALLSLPDPSASDPSPDAAAPEAAAILRSVND